MVAPLGPRITLQTIAAPLDETTAPGPFVRCYGAGEHAEPGRADATCEIDGVPVRLSASRLSDGDEYTNVKRLFALAHLLAARSNGAPGFALGALPMRLHQIVEGDLISTSFRTISFHQPSSDADASLSVYRGDATMFAQLAPAATTDVSWTVAWDTSEPMTWVRRRVNERDNRQAQIDGDVDLRLTGLSLQSIEPVAKGIRTADDATWHDLGLDAIALAPAATVPTSPP